MAYYGSSIIGSTLLTVQRNYLYNQNRRYRHRMLYIVYAISKSMVVAEVIRITKTLYILLFAPLLGHQR